MHQRAADPGLYQNKVTEFVTFCSHFCVNFTDFSPEAVFLRNTFVLFLPGFHGVSTSFNLFCYLCEYTCITALRETISDIVPKQILHVT